MKKEQIAAILDEIHTLLELKGKENPFKIRAYQAGARAVESLEGDLGKLIEEGHLTNVRGIGKALAEKIETLYYTGHLDYYEELKASIEPGLIEMLEIPGMGPKKVKALYERLGITTIEGLEKACKDGEVEHVEGFGKKTQENILMGITNRAAYGKRYLWWDANAVVEPIVEGLRKLPQVEKVEAAGSLRRKRETVGDLDIVAASEEPGPVMEWFTSMGLVSEVTARGETKSSVRLKGGMQADLRVVPIEQYYFALHHFTGSKEHNVQLRHRALGMGYSLSEWGLKLESREGILTKAVGSEEELFRTLGLSYIPPELREGFGEIEYAAQEELPRLVEVGDIRGVFHCHTTASDGRNSLKEMVRGAEALGWEYLGIADHSKSSVQAGGLTEEQLMAQVEEIRILNESGEYKVHVFSGVECDILKDGSLDYEDGVLKQLDYVVASVHSSFGMSEEDMTKRIIKAIENPYVTILGHLTGRLLLKREGYVVNVSKVIDAAIANNVVMELNANPQRLDMDWRYWHKARNQGLKCSINPDAHSIAGLGHYVAGVNIARKGWLRKEDVINTRGLREVKSCFRKKG